MSNYNAYFVFLFPEMEKLSVFSKQIKEYYSYFNECLLEVFKSLKNLNPKFMNEMFEI